MGRQKEVQEEKWLLIQIVMKDDVEESGAKKKGWLSSACFTQSLLHPKFYTEQYTNITLRRKR